MFTELAVCKVQRSDDEICVGGPCLRHLSVLIAHAQPITVFLPKTETLRHTRDNIHVYQAPDLLVWETGN